MIRFDDADEAAPTFVELVILFLLGMPVSDNESQLQTDR
jgi:hypothetical protein